MPCGTSTSSWRVYQFHHPGDGSTMGHIYQAELYVLAMAETVRFELTDGFPPPVFKTGAIGRSAMFPLSIQRPRACVPG